MRQLAKVGAAGCVGAAVATYLLAKVDFFTRFDPAATGDYLAGHWAYWVTLLVFVALAGVLSTLGREPAR